MEAKAHLEWSKVLSDEWRNQIAAFSGDGRLVGGQEGHWRFVAGRQWLRLGSCSQAAPDVADVEVVRTGVLDGSVERIRR